MKALTFYFGLAVIGLPGIILSGDQIHQKLIEITLFAFHVAFVYLNRGNFHVQDDSSHIVLKTKITDS